MKGEQIYFLWRWNLGKNNQENITDSSQVFQQLLRDDEFFELRFKRNVAEGHSKDPSNAIYPLIWEYCGHDTTQLNDMCQWAERLNLFKKELEYYRVNDVEGDLPFYDEDSPVENMVYLWEKALETSSCDCFESCLKNTKFAKYADYASFALQLFRSYLVWKDNYKSECDKLQLSTMNPHLIDKDGQSVWVESPFEIGLHQFLKYCYEATINTWVMEGVTYLKLDTLQEPLFSQSLPMTTQNQALFAVNGSGKTQRIFDQLNKNFGHYIVSGKLRTEAESMYLTKVSLWAPRQGGASNDSKLIYQYLHLLDDPETSIRYVSKHLFINREKVLKVFQSNYPNLKPHHWLLFQTSCNETVNPLLHRVRDVKTSFFDPFTPTLRLLLLVGGSWRDSFNIHDSVPDKNENPNPRLLCFDEAQCDLEAPFEGDLSTILKEFMDSASLANIPLRNVISGTALGVKKALAAIQLVQESEEMDQKLEEDISNLVMKYTATFQKDWQDMPQDSAQYHRLRRLQRIPSNESFPQAPRAQVEWQNIYDFHILDTKNNSDFAVLFKTAVERMVKRAVQLDEIDTEIVEVMQLWRVFAPLLFNITQQEVCYCFHDLIKRCRSSRSSTDVASQICIDALTYFMNNSARWASVVAHSLPLRGRYRWSVIYIENLLAKYVLSEAGREHLTLDDVAIKKLSQACQKVVKDGLKDRLERLHKSEEAEHIYMLNDLYWAAVRSDLMHKPTILQDHNSAKLMTEGFAVMRSSNEGGGIQRQWLAEHLAVQAIIDYLREKSASDPNCHQNILRKLLFDIQDDASGFGKVAEYYLAWSLGGALHRDCLGPAARKVFLGALEDAKPISGDGKLIPSEYELLSSSKQPASLIDGPLDFDMWLQRVRNDQYFQTFYFPSTSAGPDIVFMLTDINHPNHRILCCIQLKTGLHQEKKKAGQLLRSLHPLLFFSRAPEKKRRFNQELEQCISSMELKIVSLLVISSTSCERFFVREQVLTQALQSISMNRLQQLDDLDARAIIDSFREPMESKKRTKRSQGDSNVIENSNRVVTAKLSTELSEAVTRPSKKHKGAAAAKRIEDDKHKKATFQEAIVSRIDFRFAVLEQRHTVDLFGESVDTLIRVMKNMEARNDLEGSDA